MLCPSLYHLNHYLSEKKLPYSPVEMIRVACRNCRSSEVCPAMGVDEYEARALSSELGGIMKPEQHERA